MWDQLKTATRPSARLMACGLAAVILGACAPGPKTATAPSGSVRVLAAETFLADIAQNVAGDRLVVASLLAPGIDPHEFQAKPQDAIRIAESNVLIVNGLGYEAWLAKTLDAGAGKHLTIVASDGLASAADADPHRWMNPRDVVRYVENIRDGLTKADPDGTSAYAAKSSRRCSP